jgi:3-methyladenine DNA glycosylase AlkC
MKESLDSKAVVRIADSFVLAYPAFDNVKFAKLACDGLEPKELKQRVNHIIEALLVVLPESFAECADIIEALVPVWIKGNEDDAFQVFAAWPVIDFIAVKGEGQPHIALPLLKLTTALFSAEFAIRAFIKAYPQICYEYLESWLSDESEDVRRLISEGTRPRLPWAPKLSCAIVDPTRNIKLLSELKNDSSLYVRRSVANHLNDISKDHPDAVLDLCEAWYPKASDNLKWLIRHATRTLVKQGAPRVYPLLGYTADPKLASVILNVETKRVVLGGDIAFEVVVESDAKEDQSIVVDFSLDLVKANGKRQSKVFKLKNISRSSGASQKIRKSMAIKEISTRRYYAGMQKISILINGILLAQEEFELAV